MAKGASDEIDTIFEASEGRAASDATNPLKSLSAEISLGSELESSKVEVSEAAAAPREDFLFLRFSPPGLLHPERHKIAADSNGRGERHRLFHFHPDVRQ
jgi:hypothetical protein